MTPPVGQRNAHIDGGGITIATTKLKSDNTSLLPPKKRRRRRASPSSPSLSSSSSSSPSSSSQHKGMHVKKEGEEVTTLGTGRRLDLSIAAASVKDGKRGQGFHQNSASCQLVEVLSQASALPPTRSGWRVDLGLHHLLDSDFHRWAPVIEKYGIPTALLPPTASSSTATSSSCCCSSSCSSGGGCSSDGRSSSSSSSRSATGTDNTGTTTTTAESRKKEADEHIDPFHALFRTIVYQQLAGKAAATIFTRATLALGVRVSSGELVTPDHVNRARWTTPTDDMGKVKVYVNGKPSGLSRQKASYLRSLAEHFSDPARLGGSSSHHSLAAMDEEELHRRLVAVKGLGSWSVDMFCMFRLQRKNVMPVGDLGVRKGVGLFFGLKKDLRKDNRDTREIVRLATRQWQPYSTLASLYMWKIADAGGI